MKTRSRPMSSRSEGILRELVGADHEIPTIGMIAAGTRYSRSHVCYVLGGRRHGTTTFIQAMAGYLGVSMETLLSALRRPKVDPVKHRGPRSQGAGRGAQDRRRVQKRGASALRRLKAAVAKAGHRARP